MKEIKKTIEIVDRIVSNDGKFERRVDDLHPEAEAKAEVKAYEESLSAVLYQRLLDRGILRLLERQHIEDKSTEDWQRQHWLAMFDGITEGYLGNVTWYKFTPRTEEDVKDLLTYVEIDSEGGISDRDCLGGFDCKRSEIVPGYTYMFGCHCDGYIYIYKIKDVLQKLTDMLEHIMIM